MLLLSWFYTPEKLTYEWTSFRGAGHAQQSGGEWNKYNTKQQKAVGIYKWRR
jgi:hypothetical protein